MIELRNLPPIRQTTCIESASKKRTTCINKPYRQAFNFLDVQFQISVQIAAILTDFVRCIRQLELKFQLIH